MLNDFKDVERLSATECEDLKPLFAELFFRRGECDVAVEVWL